MFYKQLFFYPKRAVYTINFPHINMKENQAAKYTLIKQFLEYMINRLLPLSMTQF